MTRLILLPSHAVSILVETPQSADLLAQAVNDGILPAVIRQSYPSPIPPLRAVCIGGQVVVFPAGQHNEASADTVRLSQRHRQVLVGLADGLTSGQIAARLKISPRTVEAHIYHVRRRIGGGNRHQLVARAVTLGLIPFSPPGRPGQEADASLAE